MKQSCEDCISAGGDWECDYIHCHKGNLAQEQSLNDEFVIGDRVFFLDKCGLGIFGNVIKIDNNYTKLIVCADDMQLYEICGSKATNITDKTKIGGRDDESN